MKRYTRRVIVSSSIATILLLGSMNPIFAAGKGHDASSKQTTKATPREDSSKPKTTVREDPSKPTAVQMIQLQSNVNTTVTAFVNAYAQSKVAHNTLSNLQKTFQSALKIATDNAIVSAKATSANTRSAKHQAKVKVDINIIKQTVLSAFVLKHPELAVAQNTAQIADANLVMTQKAMSAAQKAFKTASDLYSVR